METEHLDVVTGGMDQQVHGTVTTDAATHGPHLGYFSQYGDLEEPSGRYYDVFISHAGTEKREFVAFLREELRRSWPSIRVFWDRELAPGSKAMKAIHTALEDAFVAIVVLSEPYLTRECPMDELHLLLTRLQQPNTKAKVVPVFYHASWDRVSEQVAKYTEQVNAIKRAGEPVPNQASVLSILETLAKDVDVVSRVSGFTEKEVPHECATKIIPLIIKRTAVMLSEMGKLRSHKLQHQPGIAQLVGMDARHDLLSKSVVQAQQQQSAVVLCGTPGIGKTSLATHYFNHLHSQDCTVPCSFISLGLGPRTDTTYTAAEDKHLLKQQHKLLRDLVLLDKSAMPDDTSHGRQVIWEQLTEHLREQGQKAVIVVDNVWAGQVGRLLPDDIMQVLAPGSVVLFVCRGPLRDVCCFRAGSEPVVHGLSALDDADSKALLQSYKVTATGDVLDRVVARCGGLPSALTAVARALLKESQFEVDELLNAAYSSAVYPGMHASWKALSEVVGEDPQGTVALQNERRQTLLDVAWFLNKQPLECMQPYCRIGVLDSLIEVGLMDISPIETAESGWGLQQPAAVRVHTVVVDFCKLGTGVEFQLPMKQLPPSHTLDSTLNKRHVLETSQVKDAVGLGLMCCVVKPPTSEALRTSACLRIIHLDNNQWEQRLDLELPSQRWIYCDKDVLPQSLTLNLMPSSDMTCPNWAVVVLKCLDQLEHVTISRSWQLKRLRLEACPKLREVTLQGSEHRLQRLEIESVTSLTSLKLEAAAEAGHRPTVRSITAFVQRALSRRPANCLTILPSGIHNLQYLTHLEISNCSTLEHLAPPAALCQLHISSCPLLTCVVGVAGPIGGTSQPSATGRGSQHQHQQQEGPAYHISGTLVNLTNVSISACPKLLPAPCPNHLPPASRLVYLFNDRRQDWASGEYTPCACLRSTS